MKLKTRRPALWLAFGVAAVILLAACSSSVDTGGAAVDEQDPATLIEEQVDEILAGVESDDEVVEGPSDQEDPSEEGASSEEGQVATSPNVTILTEDDRSSQLERLTSSWATNWNKHIVDYSEILSGGPPRDGIRSIDNPTFIGPEEASVWLAGNEPVIALEIDGDARAYPLQIVTWHEVVNDTVGEVPAVVTFCPLCNSALAFDRRVDGQVFEFGVSGLLRKSDLIMYDRTTETLWQQFTGEAIIGDLTGQRLTFLATSIISFDDFQAAHPDGQILSQDTGLGAPYGSNPYAGYDTYEHVLSGGGNFALFREDIDGRLAPADRVVTVTLEDVAIDVAYPVNLLSELGVINDQQGGRDLAVFFKAGTASALGARIIAEAEDVGATGVFDPNLDGQKLTFKVNADQIVDEQTESTWNILGQAIDGPLAGQALSPIVHGDHFWFSWAAFKPDTIIFQG